MAHIGPAFGYDAAVKLKHPGLHESHRTLSLDEDACSPTLVVGNEKTWRARDDRPPPRLPRHGPSDEVAYDVGEEVARGGLGRVLIAYDRRLCRPVAIKELIAGDEV